MKIDKSKYYAIVELWEGKVLDWWKNRVYEGRYVLNAYNKIKDKEGYKIYLLDGLTECK
jgi:hypothetical protein